MIRERLSVVRRSNRNVRDRLRLTWNGLSDIPSCLSSDGTAVLMQDSEVVSCGVVAARSRACECFLGFGQPVVLDEQHGKFECSVGITTLVRAGIRGRGTSNVPPLLKQHAKLGSRAGVTSLVRTREGFFGLRQPALSDEQHGELECRVGNATLLSPAIRRLSTVRVTAVREEHAEIKGSGGVFAVICMFEQFLRLGQPVLPGELDTEFERVFGVAAKVRTHRISQLPHRSCECGWFPRAAVPLAAIAKSVAGLHMLVAPSFSHAAFAARR